MQDTRLAFDDVSLIRGDRLLFRGLDFDLGPGAGAMVTGANGSGKSSLIRLAAGLLGPVRGRVVRQGTLALAQEMPALDLHRPLFQALRYWAAMDGANDSALRSAMEMMDIGNMTEVPVRMLSTGQRKRAVLARVIASGAPIWLLDEPGNGMDSTSLERLGEAMARHRAGGGIVMVASHQPIGRFDPSEIIVLDAGGATRTERC